MFRPWEICEEGKDEKALGNLEIEDEILLAKS